MFRSVKTGALFLFTCGFYMWAIPQRTFASWSQKADSLKGLMAVSGDAARLRLCMELSGTYRFIQLDSALSAARSGMKTAVMTGDQYYFARFLRQTGDIYSRLGISDSSLFYYRQSVNISREYGDLISELHGVTGLMDQYLISAGALKGIELGNRYLEHMKMCHDPEVQIPFLRTLGSCLTQSGDFYVARQYLNQALQISEGNNNLHKTGIMIRIAEWYGKKGDSLNTAGTLRNSLQCTAPADVEERADAFRKLGSLLADIFHNEDSARFWYRKGLREFRELQYVPGEALMNKCLGMSWYRQGDFNRALPCLEKASGQISGILGPLEIIPVFRALEEIYNSRGENEKAIQSHRESFHLSNTFSPDKQNENIRKTEMEEHSREIDLEKDKLRGQLLFLNRISIYQYLVIGSLLFFVFTLGYYQFLLVKRKNLLSGKLAEWSKIPSDSPVAGPVEPHDENASEVNSPGDGVIVFGKLRVRAATIQEIRQQLAMWIEAKGFTGKVTIYDLAAKLHTNPKYLSEVISVDYKCGGFNEFLNRLRIGHLMCLLKPENQTVNHTVEYLANMLGYGSRTTFIKAFKEQTGYYPNYYLKLLRKESQNTPPGTPS